MTFKSIILGLLAASSCSIICGAACDWIEPGECMSPGNLFGPCVDHQCNGDLSCFTGLAGEMCIRLLDDEIQPDEEVCRKWIGGTTYDCNNIDKACLVHCDNDGQCKGGTVCEEFVGVCLYPYDETDVKPPEGASQGPCDDNLENGCGNPTDQCVEASDGVGNICNDPLHPEHLAPCDEAHPVCPNGQVCSVADSICVWPKTQCGGEGEPYGPCPPNTHVCGPGLICLDTSSGTSCVPRLEAADDFSLQECANSFGGFGCLEDFNICMSACNSDADCKDGTTCAENWGACVWPNQDMP